MSLATISPARLAANRQNALKSSGPRTPEGKALARVNAVKHGLSGAGIALPTEDAAAVEARFESLQAEMGADTVLKAILVKQVALMSVRLDRAALQESAALSSRVRHAVADFDAARTGAVAGGLAGLDAGSGAGYGSLLGSVAGLDGLIAGLNRLQRAAAERHPGTWTAAVEPRLEAYLGHPDRAAGPERSVVLFRATLGNFDFLDPSEMAGRPRADWSRWARTELIDLLGAEIARLETLRSELAAASMADAEEHALERAAAPARALFDPGREAHLARRYEAEARRGFFGALREFRHAAAAPAQVETDVEAEAAEVEAVVVTGASVPPRPVARPETAGMVVAAVVATAPTRNEPKPLPPDRPFAPIPPAHPTGRIDFVVGKSGGPGRPPVG